MKAYEFLANITTEGNIELPDVVLQELVNQQQVKVILLVDEPKEEQEEVIVKGMDLNYKSRPQPVQKLLNFLSEEILAQAQPIISSNTLQSWECVHFIPGISGNIAFSPREDILASIAASVITCYR